MSPILGIYASQDYVRIPPSSYESIATVTASGGESSLSFTSIPSTYRSLQIRGIARYGFNANQSLQFRLQFNSDSSAANYISHDLAGNGSTVTAQAISGQSGIYIPNIFTGNTALANTFGVGIFDIIDYSNTSKNKTVRSFAGADANAGTTAFEIHLSSGLWMSTTAVTSVTLFPVISFAAGSTFSLYGIKGA